MIVSLLIKQLIGLVFISTAYSKLRGMDVFENAILGFIGHHMKRMINVIARCIVGLEIICGAQLILSASYGAEIIAIFLFILFSAVILFHLRRKTLTTCSCGGFLGNEMIHIRIPIRNGVMILGLVWVMITPQTPFLLQSIGEKSYWMTYIPLLFLALSILVTYYFYVKVNSILRHE
ncbi:hypothetical protein BVG16_03010 [Paenibacillus selenitireducens]|uniref:Methylamine utilisation protein MauE domain-containing protein n=1 Tax=Paenibacillus selenitireducens TaxID=1324314 RepID=A0A1T2XNA2_9BACL|nr:MauE/DoxX family redox-associated membrane protein [Paenibacillus selenitireducens]OPA81302.1 hypothetical protein BVG16_03010 [Paenibacillus selenitireducens]